MVSRSHSRWGRKVAEGPRFRDALRAAGLGGVRAPRRLSLLGLHWGQGSPHHGPLLPVIAANELACRGLDHLEEKIPALQYPPEKVSLFLFSNVPRTVVNAPREERA